MICAKMVRPEFITHIWQVLPRYSNRFSTPRPQATEPIELILAPAKTLGQQWGCTGFSEFRPLLAKLGAVPAFRFRPLLAKLGAVRVFRYSLKRLVAAI